MTTVNITVNNDADFYRTFRWQTTAGSPIDMTGMELEMMLRRHAKDVAAVLRLGTDTGEIVLTDSLGGTFTVRIGQEQLERLGLGDYDQSLIASRNSRKVSVWNGLLTNNAGPTR
jgi:hypothetical protein